MMKNWMFCALAALLSLTAACTKDEPGAPAGGTDPAGEPMRFYGVGTAGAARGAAQHDRLWHNGTTLRVKFLNGDSVLHRKVAAHAREWERYANITFNFVDSGPAHIRVGFDWNDNRYVTWSYIGTDSKFETDQSEATMSFAYLAYVSEEVLRGDVLRAFGQALGLELESRNIHFDPLWAPNPAVTPNYWSFNIGDADWALLRRYVFDPLDPDNALSSAAYDPRSIMRWPFPPNVLLNGGPQSANTVLSDEDKRFVAELYPGREQYDVLATMVAHRDHLYSFGFGVDSDAVVVVDCGEAGIEAAAVTEDWRSLLDTFFDENDNETCTLTLRGKTETLDSLYISGFDVLDLSGCTRLTYLDCSKCYYLVSLDLSNSPLLEDLFCGSCWALSDLDLSSNPRLKSLNIFDNSLTSLDLSGNPAIEEIRCFAIPFLADPVALAAFGASLPDRTGLAAGVIIDAGGSGFPGMIANVLAAKNWVVQ